MCKTQATLARLCVPFARRKPRWRPVTSKCHTLDLEIAQVLISAPLALLSWRCRRNSFITEKNRGTNGGLEGLPRMLVHFLFLSFLLSLFFSVINTCIILPLFRFCTCLPVECCGLHTFHTHPRPTSACHSPRTARHREKRAKPDSCACLWLITWRMEAQHFLLRQLIWSMSCSTLPLPASKAMVLEICIIVGTLWAIPLLPFWFYWVWWQVIWVNSCWLV